MAWVAEGINQVLNENQLNKLNLLSIDDWKVFADQDRIQLNSTISLSLSQASKKKQIKFQRFHSKTRNPRLEVH